MSVLVVGLSHKGAPLTMLERTVLTGDALAKLLHHVAANVPRAAGDQNALRHEPPLIV